MQKSQLIGLYKTLQKSEIKEFGKYVATSFFNKNERVIKLHSLIAKYFPDFTHAKLKKENAAKFLFSRDKTADPIKSLPYVMSDLKKHVEDYLVWKESQVQAIDREYLLLKSFESRKADIPFFQSVNRLKEKLEASEKKDMNYYYHQFPIHHLIFSHDSTQRISLSVDGLDLAMENVDLFYFTTKLKYACEMANRESIIANDNKQHILLFEELKKITSEAPFSDNLLFEAYRLYIDLCQDFNDDKYFRLKELVFTQQAIFGEEELKEIYFFLINYGLSSYDNGNPSYLNEVFELYKMGLENKLLIHHGDMDHVDFNNIVNVACSLKAFDWVDQFIEENAVLLRAEVRENAKTLSMAEVEVNKGEFELALDLMREIDFLDDYDKLRAKVMQLKSYYELPAYDMVLYNFFDSFTVFVRRNKTFAEDFKKSYINLISLAKRLYKAKQNVKTNKQELIGKIEEIDNLPYRSWITAKLEELEV